jgi:uncharacterized protein DUF2844
MKSIADTAGSAGHRPAAPMRFFLRMLPLILIATVHGWASLGGDVSTVQGDQAQMRASLNVTQHASYAVHEMKAGSGTLVREYVSPAGKVFGVAWRGPFPPNLQQVLGSYYDQYTAAQEQLREQPMRSHRAPVVIQTPGLVVVSTGHNGAYSGQAYVPEMLPANVNAKDIR